MARPKVNLNHAGIASILQSPTMQRLIRAKTEQIADKVRNMNIDVDGDPGKYALPVTTDVSVTDRARGRVTLAHPAGEAVQAKHGALTKAAAQSGMDVGGGK